MAPGPIVVVSRYRATTVRTQPAPAGRNPHERIYRSFSYGNLADVIAIDTRVIGRDEAVIGLNSDKPALPDLLAQLHLSPRLKADSHPHIRYVEGEHRGYFLLDLNQERAQAEWIFVDTPEQPESGFTPGERWMTRSGNNQLEPGQSPSAPGDVRIPAPIGEKVV